jgi:hypothetical protein
MADSYDFRFVPKLTARAQNESLARDGQSSLVRQRWREAAGEVEDVFSTSLQGIAQDGKHPVTALAL